MVRLSPIKYYFLKEGFTFATITYSPTFTVILPPVQEVHHALVHDRQNESWFYPKSDNLHALCQQSKQHRLALQHQWLA
jgi:hypothetical protein